VGNIRLILLTVLDQEEGKKLNEDRETPQLFKKEILKKSKKRHFQSGGLNE
jgi:hypothetical protein